MVNKEKPGKPTRIDLPEPNKDWVLVEVFSKVPSLLGWRTVRFAVGIDCPTEIFLKTERESVLGIVLNL